MAEFAQASALTAVDPVDAEILALLRDSPLGWVTVDDETWSAAKMQAKSLLAAVTWVDLRVNFAATSSVTGRQVDGRAICCGDLWRQALHKSLRGPLGRWEDKTDWNVESRVSALRLTTKAQEHQSELRAGKGIGDWLPLFRRTGRFERYRFEPYVSIEKLHAGGWSDPGPTAVAAAQANPTINNHVSVELDPGKAESLKTAGPRAADPVRSPEPSPEPKKNPDNIPAVCRDAAKYINREWGASDRSGTKRASRVQLCRQFVADRELDIEPESLDKQLRPSKYGHLLTPPKA